MILRPNKQVITQPNHIWPTLTDEEWIKVEVELKNLILNDYAKKNNVNVTSLTQLEIKDIILGMEIAPQSLQKEQIKEIEKSGNEASLVQQITTTTTNVQGEQICVTTLKPYEQQQFRSHADWRVRAISATNLHLRTNNIFVNSENLGETGYAFILPQNILKKFITIGDLKTQVFGYLYGVSPPDHDMVKEVRCIVMVPQIGNRDQITLHSQYPESEYLKNLEPLGWIHTQPTEQISQLSAFDINLHSKFLKENDKWDAEKCIIVTVSFTQGSCTLTSYKLTHQGFEWGKNNKELTQAQGYTQTMYEKVQLLLSTKVNGFFMVPDNQVWNYNFIGLGLAQTSKYGLILQNPKDFYNEIHRPSHFINFNRLDDTEEQNNVDLDDYFS
eukprot:TRINITY_DN808_c0_g1_i4.p1 TRINITY_DN808_c0_g1~~TRINITY_DN808_c0_g1_i4.p1  ORF type:complete len:386 (-),score=60.43 TRINITY_DN808_c0_g1_i4:27-1184(-)